MFIKVMFVCANINTALCNQRKTFTCKLDKHTCYWYNLTSQCKSCLPRFTCTPSEIQYDRDYGHMNINCGVRFIEAFVLQLIVFACLFLCCCYSCCCFYCWGLFRPHQANESQVYTVLRNLRIIINILHLKRLYMETNSLNIKNTAQPCFPW